MTQIFQRKEIEDATSDLDVVKAMEEAFVAYSKGNAVIPPIGHLQFTDPPGDTCIKYGYQKGGDTFVVKIASGFYDNPKHGLPSSNGIMLVFSQKTGQTLAVLLDDGYLTDVRTGAAGAVAAKHLGPKKITGIGIVGTGTQARFQLRALAKITSCTDVVVSGRSREKCEAFIRDMKEFNVRAGTMEELCNASNVIVTTTPSQEPLLFAKHIRPGTHITAMGSDGPGKQELDPHILAKARFVCADSISQCQDIGEISYGLKAQLISSNHIRELGAVIAQGSLQREPTDITVADLCGVAIQDVAIASSVYDRLAS